MPPGGCFAGFGSANSTPSRGFSTLSEALKRPSDRLGAPTACARHWLSQRKIVHQKTLILSSKIVIEINRYCHELRSCGDLLARWQAAKPGRRSLVFPTANRQRPTPRGSAARGRDGHPWTAVVPLPGWKSPHVSTEDFDYYQPERPIFQPAPSAPGMVLLIRVPSS